MHWQDMLVSPDTVITKIRPGMGIFLGTGMAEPRTLVKHLMTSDAPNLQDLELIQLLSFGEAISLKALQSQKYRLKTFFSGWAAAEAITAGGVDLIPSRFARIPHLFESGQIEVDAAFVQITPPDRSGNCSLGVAIDVARLAMEQASLVVGEINPQIPRTYGDTFVHLSDFHLLIQSDEPPLYFAPWPVDPVFDRIARNIAAHIEDRACVAFTIGPLFDALAPHLAAKHHLGVHSPLMTDALMDLIKSGAVTNRFKDLFRGKSLASYAFGSRRLMAWLDRNPQIEFQGIDKVFNPATIARNDGFTAMLPARKVDLTGGIVLHVGKANIATGPTEIIDFFNGAEISRGGRTIFGLPSRNRKGENNIRISVERFHTPFSFKESVDMVATEYGVAQLKGRTVRERAQALIDIAHPDDRAGLVKAAKEKKILYQDQIFLADSAPLFPADIQSAQVFKNGVKVRFRAIKPSDEEEMRRLFYRFSDEAVYYRYFSAVKTMPHARMQEYVNVDWSRTMAIVGLVGKPGRGHIIAEARYILERERPYAEVAFVVDEQYQGLGISTFLYRMLTGLAKDRGLAGFTAQVLSSNKAMMKVFKKGGLAVEAVLDNGGVYDVTIHFRAVSTAKE